MRFKSIQFAAVLTALLLLAGCSSDRPLESSSEVAEIAQFSAIPNNATITSAALWVHTPTLDNNLVYLYRVTSSWTEGTVTWNSFAGAVDSTALSSSQLNNIGYFSFDLSGYATQFLDGTEDYGFLLRLDPTDPTPEFITGKEAGANAAYLEICFDTGDSSGCVTVNVAADAPIYSGMPTQNYGGMGLMTLGPVGVNASFEILLSFDVPVEEGQEEPLMAVGDFVWLDENMDGVQDSGEFGLGGVVVNLIGCSDDTLADPIVLIDTTDADGFYLFDSLVVGQYSVQFERPDGYLFSPQYAADAEYDSDADPSTGATTCFEPFSPTAVLAIDAGLYPEQVEPDDSGCTHGKGYWKNHTGLGSQENLVSSLLPLSLGSLQVTDAQTAFDVLSQNVYGSSCNGITKLMAQLLAAKLNVAHGADGFEIAETIDHADSLLTVAGWEDWDSLEKTEKKTVLCWKDRLEKFNSGEIGPGSCDDDDVTGCRSGHHRRRHDNG